MKLKRSRRYTLPPVIDILIAAGIFSVLLAAVIEILIVAGIFSVLVVAAFWYFI